MIFICEERLPFYMPFAVVLAMTMKRACYVVFLTMFSLLFAFARSSPYSVNGNTEPALKDETGKTWHDVEVWTLSLRTTDNPSRADQREHFAEPQQDNENSRPVTADRKTRKRRKLTQRLKKLLLLIFVSGLWSDIILLPKCILNILVSSV
jgi:hypothetical protein